MKTTKHTHWTSRGKPDVTEISITHVFAQELLEEIRTTHTLFDHVVTPYDKAQFSVQAVHKLAAETQKRYGFSPSPTILAEFFVELVKLLNE